MKNFETVLNAKINTIIYTLYYIGKVNGFTYIYTYTSNPIPGRGERIGKITSP